MITPFQPLSPGIDIKREIEKKWLLHNMSSMGHTIQNMIMKQDQNNTMKYLLLRLADWSLNQSSSQKIFKIPKFW